MKQPELFNNEAGDLRFKQLADLGNTYGLLVIQQAMIFGMTPLEGMEEVNSILRDLSGRFEAQGMREPELSNTILAVHAALENKLRNFVSGVATAS